MNPQSSLSQITSQVLYPLVQAAETKDHKIVKVSIIFWPQLVNFYLKQVISTWLVRGISRGLSPMNADGREWNLNQILFADDTAFVADAEERLKHLVEGFGRVYKRRKL